MKVHFLGAAQTVTGSCYIIEAHGTRFAVDCGMHQGNKEIEKRNRENDLYLKEGIDFFLVTHAHIDHSGLLPRMVRDGFKGSIYCTEPTQSLLDIMLLDSAHIQEMEAEWENRKQSRKGTKKKVEPLYTQDDALKTSQMLKAVAYDESFEPAPGVKVTYRNAGHILGSAFVEVEVKEAEGSTRLLFSGDLGRANALLLNDPADPQIRADYLFMESTYGDREHKDIGSSRDELYEAIKYSYERGGKVVIPAFAVERTQEILYTLYQLRKEERLPANMPVFVDSPLAIRATEVFKRFPLYMDEEIRELAAKGDSPDFLLPNVRFTLSKEDSQSINEYKGSAIIISASGMCNAGRIKHHLRHNIWDPNSSIVFVGYQGLGTPGRQIVDGAKNIRMLGEDLAVGAKIFTIGGFSAHAGQSQILDWIDRAKHENMQVILVHGEPKTQEVLAGVIRDRFKLEVHVPEYLEEMTLAHGMPPMVQTDVQRAKPRVKWEVILQDSEAKMNSIRQQLDEINSLSWEEQVGLRDALLEINTNLLHFLARI